MFFRSRDVAALVATAWIAASASAGGLYLNEFPGRANGTAGAGGGAMAVDASTTYHNPAGMTRLEGHQLMLGAGLVFGDIRFDPDAFSPLPGGDGGQQGGPGPLGGLYYVHSITDRLKIGADFTAVSGAVLDPDNGWTGRLQNQKVSILVMELSPDVAFKVTDWLSVGGGVRIQRSQLTYKVGFPPPLGASQLEFDQIDAWAIGGKFGLLVEPSERTRLGFRYFSETSPELSGPIRGPRRDATVSTEIVFPTVLTGDIYHELNDTWALMATVRWEQWSAFDEQFIGLGPLGASVDRSFDDTWYFGAGVHYRLNDRWLLTSGVSYDTNPSTSQFRTADMPLDRQVRFAVGGFYDYSENVELGGVFTYAWYGNAPISDSTLRGKFNRNQLFFFNFTFNWKRVPWGRDA